MDGMDITDIPDAGHDDKQDNSDKIQSFCGVTDCEPVEAHHYLEACGGDLAAAIQLYLQARGDDDVVIDKEFIPIHDNQAQVAATSIDKGEKSSQPVTSLDPDHVRPPITKKAGVLVDDPLMIYEPMRKRRPMNTSVFDAIRYGNTSAAATGGHASLDAAEGTVAGSSYAAAKRQTLAELFKPPVRLLHVGNFQSAKESAVKQGKWLLVNVQDTSEFASQVLNRDIWNNSAIQELVENNFVLLQVFHDTAEGARLQSYYRINQFPFVGILDPRTGELLTTVSTYDNVSFGEAIMIFLEQHPTFEQLDRNFSEPIAASATRRPATASAQLTNGSAAASHSIAKVGSERHHRSNGDCVALPDAKRAHKDYSSKSPDLIDMVYSDSSDNEDDYERNMPSIEDFLDSEPSGVVHKHKRPSSSPKPVAADDWKAFDSTEGVPIQLLIRFPDNVKDRITLHDGAKLKALMLYIAGRGFSLDKFEVVLNFPTRNLSQLDSNLTLAEAKFGNQETVFVHDK